MPKKPNKKKPDVIESAPKHVEEKRSRVLHPASAVLILGADWLLFSATAASAGAGVLLSMTLGFFIGAVGVTALQRFTAQENWPIALLKGFVAGVLVGVPFPIGGTVVGGSLLALSGLDSLKRLKLPNSR